MTIDTTAVQFAGIDIGSRTIKLLVVDGTGAVRETFLADTGFDPMATASELIETVSFDRIMATGYGRNLFELSFDAPTVTEIKAHARGAWAEFPDARTVLDIGGQDSKAIALFDSGRVKKFEMTTGVPPARASFWRSWPPPWDLTWKTSGPRLWPPKKIW